MEPTLKHAQAPTLKKYFPKGHNIWPPGVSYIVEGKTLLAARP